MRRLLPLLTVQLAATLFAQPLPTFTGKLTTLHTFHRGAFSVGGNLPQGPLTLGRDGTFYGTTTTGGTRGWGTIFKISNSGEHSILYNFTGGADGQMPRAGLTLYTDGSLYGSTNNGVLFRITPLGTFTNFGRAPGPSPTTLILAKDGNFYGTSSGFSNVGAAFFRLTPNGALTVLANFQAFTPPPFSLTEGPDGNFYGTERRTVFKVTPTGVITVLLRAPDGSAAASTFDGLREIASALTLGPDGNFYGVAIDGVFKVTATGVFTRIARFSENSITGQGNSPYVDDRTRLTLGADGSLYGSNEEQGPTVCGYCGSVYQVTRDNKLKVIFRFAGSGSGNSYENQGRIPNRVVQGPDGLYGTTLDGGANRQVTGGYVTGAGVIFKITCDTCAGTGTTPPLTSTSPPGPIQALDPNNSSDANKDQLLRRLLQNEATWDNYETFATHPTLAQGAVADGVTPLILRCTIPAADAEAGVTVMFNLTGDDAQPGTTAELGSLGCVRSDACAQAGTSYPGETQKVGDTYYAFVRWTTPLDYARPNTLDEKLEGRFVRFTATLPGDRTSASVIVLRRPPVVLLHGIWSSADTWTWTDPGGLQADSRFLVHAEDYSGTAADSYHVNLGLDPAKGANSPAKGIKTVLDRLRAQGIAATQADFIGHSMGGLLGRMYAGEYRHPDPPPGLDPVLHYYRPDNFGKGEIHKLITLTTPHLGSELATGLMDEAGQNRTLIGDAAEKVIGCVLCGAAADLRPNSPPLAALPEARVYGHAITAGGGNQAIENAGTLGDVLDASALNLPLKGIGQLLKLGYDLKEYFQGSARHDLIVTVASQNGRMPAGAITFFDYAFTLDTPIDWALHVTVTHEARVSAKVIELLHAPARSSLFAAFPAAP